MRRLALAALPFLALLAHAERMARPVTVRRTGVTPADGRIVATPKGFAAAVKTKGGCAISEFDAAGKDLRQVSYTDAEPAGWWLSHDAETVAVVRGGVLHIESALREGLERIDEEPLPSGPVVFSPDDTRLAFLAGGKAVVRERSKEGKRVELPVRKNRVLFEGPIFSGDGKKVLVVTGPVNGDAPDSPVGSPDTIEECDPFAEKPVWLEAHKADSGPIRGLCASKGSSKVAFVAAKGGKQVLLVLDLSGGASDDLIADMGIGEIAFPAGGREVLFTGKGRAGRSHGFTIATSRSGTGRGFACDVVASPENEDVSSPVASGDSFFFVSRSATDKDKVEVIRSSPK